MPSGVYESGYEHRIVARALEARGLIAIRGSGVTWSVTLTDLGRLWPVLPDSDRAVMRPGVPLLRSPD